jgi:ABC-type cobalamin/Fe3+-siderophores transport system ATPase subunit
MTSLYKGMRWLKCDLQVQTPEDERHWQDNGLKLLNPRRPKNNGQPDEGNIQEKARIFLRRCHELGLDLIGITDHNFSARSDPRDWFAVHLVEQNKTVAKEFDRHPLVIMPGFEVDIGYHVLCIFHPAKKQKHFENCNRILTTLGLAEDARFDQNGPKQLRHNNQRVSLKKLIEIVQGEHGGIVIAAHADQNSGLFSDTANREDYANSELYCVELTQNPPAQKHQEILASNNNAWQRGYSHPAWIMSSDAKSIGVDNDGKPVANSLGYRYTWIKMSKPSVESLRQAFLDHDSRIRVPLDISTDKPPGDQIKQSVIRSISIKDAVFLADQDAYFSPNMNCVIGGRGSGKSTLLEYLRVMLGKDKDLDLDMGTRERIRRVKSTLDSQGSTSSLELCWESAEGVEDRIVWEGGRPVVKDLELEDPDTYFENLQVSFYSQQQLNRLTDSRTDERGVRQADRLLELVDGFAKDELSELEQQGDAIKRQINQAFSLQRAISEQKTILKRLKQERQELERQWKAQSDIQGPAQRHQALKGESRYLERIKGAEGQRFSDVADLADEVANAHVLFSVALAPHSEWFAEIDARVKAAKDKFAADIRKSTEAFDKTISELVSEHPNWPAIKSDLDQADREFEKACADKGLSPEDVGHLQEINHARSRKDEEIEGVENEMGRLGESAGDPEALIAELHEVWRHQFDKREEAVKKANDLAVLDGGGGHRFIEVSAVYQQDSKAFSQLWGKFGPDDKRIRLGKGWDEIGDQLYKKFSEDNGASASPWQYLKNRIDSDTQSAGADLTNLQIELYQHIQANAEKWESLQVSRVEDAVDMKLFRPDATEAGSIANGSLSDGQRNTAALALLLAQDGGPLVIDQPEDELDSNFVFRELIPMLRKVKNKRQLIMATHNANLPVNGDAELVYAFEAKNGRGEVLAQGGLDQGDVTKAVLDIMEGTEEAFRRRREKYHF